MSRVPKYCRHRGRNLAYVRINGQAVYLGRWQSEESRREYDRIVAELLSGRGKSAGRENHDLTVAELLDQFRQYAESYYRLPDGSHSSELSYLQSACRPLLRLYGHTLARSFGPLALEAIRAGWIREKLSRAGINARVDRIKRVFKWAVSRELVPSSVYESIRTLAGLRRGRSEARETAPILPVSAEVVDATKRHLGRIVRGMVEFQSLTGARPGEVCAMRVEEIDCSGDVWTYRPSRHKTEHHGRERVIRIGKRGQVVLAEFLGGKAAGDYLFQPREAMAEFRQSRRANRKTPDSYGNRPGTNRKAKPQRTPGASYTVVSYRRAINRAADLADLEAKAEAARAGREIKPDARLIPRWHPNQLRHKFATEVRKQLGLEAAQVMLGHSRADVTQIYAEKNHALAEQVAAEIG